MVASGFRDDHEPPTPATLAEFLGLVTDQGNQPVFVHCVGGRHPDGCHDGGHRAGAGSLDTRPGLRGNEALQVRTGIPAQRVQEFVYRYGAELTRGAPAQTVNAPPKTADTDLATGSAQLQGCSNWDVRGAIRTLPGVLFRALWLIKDKIKPASGQSDIAAILRDGPDTLAPFSIFKRAARRLRRP
jgi:hypothetical protein